jgi:uncharacterized protein (TIGR03435 family)
VEAATEQAYNLRQGFRDGRFRIRLFRSGQLVGLLAPVSLVAASGQSKPEFEGLTPEFEVASVKPGLPPKRPCGDCKGQFNQDAVLLDYRGVQLAEVIRIAYGLDVETGTESQSIWTDRYDIRAKIPSDVSTNQVPMMLRKLLVERFGLVVHEVTKERKEYSLVVAKGGRKMRSVDPQREFNWAVMGGAGGRRVVGRWTMDQLAELLSEAFDGPVINKTDLQGFFDIRLDYLPGDLPVKPVPGIGGPFLFDAPRWQRFAGRAGALPDLPDALEGQLGLKLEPHVKSVDILVVDHADKVPTEK